MLVHEFPFFLLLLKSERRWHTQICSFRCFITSVLQVCMGCDLINAVAARWLDGKCQRLLATALKVQHCWTLKTTVGDCRRQSPTCAGDSRQLKYKHARDCRQCWKFPQVRRSEADNFGGGPGTFCWFFLNFMFMICNPRHMDQQLFLLSFKHWLSAIVVEPRDYQRLSATEV